MATVSGTTVAQSKGVYVTTWTGMKSTASAGSALLAPNLPDKTVSVYGAFATGCTITIEGSNSATGTYFTLNDSRGEGNALTFATGDVKQLLENPLRVRPRVTANGTGAATSLTV